MMLIVIRMVRGGSQLRRMADSWLERLLLVEVLYDNINSAFSS